MKSGFRVIDSDIHLFEPAEFWGEYLEPRYRERAPRVPERGFGALELEGRTVPAYMDRPERQRAMRNRTKRAAARAAEVLLRPLHVPGSA